MAFGSISKYTKIVSEKGITQQSVAEKMTKTAVAAEQSASIFSKEDATSESDPIQTTVSETTDATSSMQKAIDSYTKAMKLQTTVTALTSLANLFGLSDSTPSYNYSATSTGSGTGTTGATGNTTLQADTIDQQMGISNTLESAIQNYSKNNKSSDTWTALINQTAAAKSDLNSIASYKQEQQAIINSYPQKLQELQNEVEKLKQEKIEAGKQVDANREGIQLNIRKTSIESKEIPAQEKIVTDSKKKVSDAQTKLTSDLKGQDDIITEATPDLNATKQVTKTDANGNVTTETVPDTNKRTAAKSKIDAANKKKQELQAAFDKLKKEEEKVQKDANAKIEDLKKELKDEVEPKLANCGKTQQELEAVQKRYADAIDNLNKKNDEIDKLKSDKSTAQTNLSTAESKEKSINKLIEKADKLMVDKK